MSRRQRDRQSLRFLAAFAGILAVFLAGLALLLGFLYNTWEVGGIDALVARQLRENGIYGTAFKNDTLEYKLELYGQIRPEVMVVGSSRVMQVRQEMFKRTMVNMGGAASTVAQMSYLMDLAFREHRPKLVIVGVDFWLLNANWPEPPILPLQKNGSFNFSLSNLLDLYDWIVQGRIPVGDIIGRGLSLERSKGAYGLAAIYTGAGFDAHGSRRPPNDTSCTGEPLFEETLERVRSGTSRFQYGESVDKRRLAALSEFIRKLRSREVEVVVFLPPVAPQVFAAMVSSGRYGFVDELTALGDLGGVTVYNFLSQPGNFSSDCEYLDGFHGGDIVYARMLASMAKANPAIAKVVNTETLSVAARESGRPVSDLMRLPARRY